MELESMPEWDQLFIGRDQDLIWLKRLWTDVKSLEPRFCVLRGESGFGKTKIIQKFYSDISSSALDDPNHYWPDTLLKEQNNLKINPSHSHFSDSVEIPWLWWGLRWTNPIERNQHESIPCGLLAGLDYLKPHQEALLPYESRSKLRNKVALETALVAVNFASLGTVGAIAGALKSLYDFKQMHHEEKLAQKHEQLTVEDRQQQAIAQRLEILMDFFESFFNAKLGKAALPVILVLDDAQWIDADSTHFMAELLDKAARQQWPLFVLATHWEQEWNISDSAHAPDKIPALYQQLATRYPQICSLRDIDRLDGLGHIVKAAFPGLTDEQIHFLCERADGNPRLLHEIVLELIGEPYYFDQQNQQLALTSDALTELRKKSFALHDVQERRFRNMNQALQSLLSYASYQGMSFIKDMVLELATVLDSQQTPDSTEQTFASAIRPYATIFESSYATIFESSAVLYEFRHRVFYDLAKARIDKFPSLEKTIANALTSIGSQWYQSRKHEALELDERESFCLLLLKLLASQPADPKLQRAVLIELLALYQEGSHFAKAVPWLGLLETLVTAEPGHTLSEIPFWGQYSLIRLLKELNRWPLAESLAQALLITSRNQAGAEPDNEEKQKELSANQILVGDIDLAQDRLPQALENFRSALATFELLVELYGETAERLRDVFISCFLIATCCTDSLKEQAQWLHQALATNQHRMLAYPQYAQQTIPEQQQLIGFYKVVAEELSEQYHLEQLADFERQLELFQQQ